MLLLNGAPLHKFPAVRWPLDALKQHSMVFHNAPGSARNDYVIARPERTSGEAAFGQLRRRVPFNYPELHFPFFVWGLHFKKGMRIAP